MLKHINSDGALNGVKAFATDIGGFTITVKACSVRNFLLLANSIMTAVAEWENINITTVILFWKLFHSLLVAQSNFHFTEYVT